MTERHTDGGETRRKEVGWSGGVKPMCRVCQPCDVTFFFSAPERGEGDIATVRVPHPPIRRQLSGV